LLLALKRVHFAFDSSILESNSKRALDDAAEKLRSMTEVDLYVDGHTDERGTTEYNMSLGERRARTVVDYLKSSGVETNRLSIVSFGEEKPMANGAGEREYALNRRVEYRLMRGKVQFVLEEGDLIDDDGSPLSDR
jgi:peptidoglycan-associated lipoprotein